MNQTLAHSLYGKSVAISFFVQIWPRKEKDDSGFAACEVHIGSPIAMCPSEGYEV